MELKMKLVYFLSAFFFFTVFNFGQNEVKTKMALLLKKNDDFVRLKANDRIKVNDKFFIVVQPLSDSYNYVIFTEGNETSLLNNLKDVKIKKITSLFFLLIQIISSLTATQVMPNSILLVHLKV